MSRRQMLLAQLEFDLTEDIRFEINEGIDVTEVVDRVVPKGSPGSSFGRKDLRARINRVMRIEHESLDLVTCLQIADAFGWKIGLVEDDEEE